MKRLNDKLHDIKLTGCCFWAYENSQPVFCKLENQFFLAVYSTKEKADAALPLLYPGVTESGSISGVPAISIPVLKLKQITDGLDFFDSVKGQVRVMLDPYIVNGNTRFLEITDGTLVN